LEEAKRKYSKEKLRLFKLIIFGPPRAGKSTLFKVLKDVKDEDLKKVSNSTGVCHRQLFKVTITQQDAKCQSKWREISIHEEISRLRSVLKEKFIKEENESDKKLSEEKNTSGNSASPLQSEVEKEMCETLSQPDADSKDINTLMVCYDSGGQPEFFDVIPALATNPTGYIMVLDLSKKLDEQIDSKIVIDGKVIVGKKIICNELMKGALAVIQSQSCEKRLLIVGTHLEEFIESPGNTKEPEKKLGKIDKQILESIMQGDDSLVRERQEEKSTQYLHPIDNLTKSDKRDSIAQEICTAVENMSENDNIHKEVPINWLLFQLEIQLQIENTPKKNYIARASCSKCAEQCLIDESKIDEVLKYFHDLGIILYYKEVGVVFSPQWLFDQLSQIIFQKYKKDCGSIVRKKIEEGIIEKETFKRMYKDTIDAGGLLTVDRLLDVFVSQNIIARFPNDENKFFMPALRNPAPPDSEQIFTKYEKCYETLYVKIDESHFPHGAFCCLAVHFMDKRWKIQNEFPYSNKIIFQNPHDEYQFVGLVDKKTKLDVEVYQKDKNGPIIEISELLYNFLLKFCKKIQTNCTVKFGFACNSGKPEHFARVKLQYPYSTKKCCEKCNTDFGLKSDEMAWLISQEDVAKISNPMVCT